MVFAQCVISAILIAPIAVYIYKFGFHVTSDHARWSEMGSAMSGLYGPILAWFAFGVVMVQARMQADSNKHAYDQAYIQNAREDVNFYITRLEEVLDKPTSNERTPRDILISSFAFASIEQLSSDELKPLCRAMNLEIPQLQASWSAIYSIYEGLRCNEEQPYSLQFTSAKQKAIVLLSYPVCVALDHYVYCVSEGRLRHYYNFSRILPTP
jgi:hypothetical protein